MMHISNDYILIDKPPSLSSQRALDTPVIDNDAVNEITEANSKERDPLPSISSYIDALAPSLWPVNVTIHDNPELAYKEYLAHRTLVKFLEARAGWAVTPSAYGIETAVVAVWDSNRKGHVVSFNAEYDSLPEIGHACGHNLIMSASVAAALATADYMSKHEVPGKVVLFGTPAEESGGGKIALLNAGAYEDHSVDISLISHPGIVPDNALMQTSACARFKIEYFGRASHAAANPWLAINALDALIVGYNAVSMLRQQTMPGDSIQGIITEGGSAPNIIPGYAAAEYIARANTRARLATLKRKVDACFESGAMATGATLKITSLFSYDDHMANHALGRVYRSYFNRMGGQILPPELDVIEGRTVASTDQGNISYAIPSLSPGFWIRPGKQGNGPHSPDFAEASGRKEAFELSLRVGKGLAATAVKVLTSSGLLEEVKKEFQKKTHQEGML